MASCALGRPRGANSHFLMPPNAHLTRALPIARDAEFLPVLHSREPVMGGTASLDGSGYRAMYYAYGCSDLYVRVPLGSSREHGNNRVDLALRLLRRTRCPTGRCSALQVLSEACWSDSVLRRELLRVNGSLQPTDVPPMLQSIATSTPQSPAPVRYGEFSGRGFLNFYLAARMREANVSAVLMHFEYPGRPERFHGYPFKTELLQRSPVVFYRRAEVHDSFVRCTLARQERCSFCTTGTPLTRRACGIKRFSAPTTRREGML